MYIYTDDTPTLEQLIQLDIDLADHKPVSLTVIERINDYNKLGVFLLDDKDGSIVERIEQDKKDTSKIVFEIFSRWLRGEGKASSNRTWERLVHYLRKIKNIALAEDIDSILQVCTVGKYRCSQGEREQIYQDKAAEYFQELEPPGFNLHNIIITAAVTILTGIISGTIMLLCYFPGK